MKLCVVGLGYIGLPTSVMFADSGCEVVGVDTEAEIIESIRNGHITIEEAGLEGKVMRCIANGTLRTELRPEEADVYIIAVPTPNACDKCLSCDIRAVIAACKEILPFLQNGNLVIVESTIAPRTLEDYIKPLFENEGYHIGETLYLAHCPERVLPGKILYEMCYNNRIIGGITPECTEQAANVYRKFVKGKIIKTDAKTAEITKCIENTYRDVNIALSNELAKICNELQINCLDVIKVANEHPRVNLLSPGPGVGGHCLAVDPYFIYAKLPHLAKLIKTGRDINTTMPYYVVQNTVRLLHGIKEPKIVAMGIAYKGNTDDIRESPAIKVVDLLEADGFKIQIYDPYIKSDNKLELTKVVKESDLLLILTDHDEFRDIDYSELVKGMRRPYIFDTRNIVIPEYCKEAVIINYGNLYQFV